MPKAAKLMIFVMASVENFEPSTITAGTTAASTRAYGGTCRVAENFLSSELPMIMPSRP